MQRRSKVLITVAIIAAVLVGLRLALPDFLKNAINRQLHALEAYDGHVDDVDVALWRGASRLKGIELVKRGGNASLPFVRCQRVDVSIQWRALLSGSLASEVKFFSPDVNLVQSENKQESQLGIEENWKVALRRIEKFFPFRFNSIQVTDGRLTFTAPGIRTQDAITAEHLNGWITNLTNVADSTAGSFAAFKFEARVLGDAPAKVNGTLDPLAAQPTFEVNMAVEGVQLPKLNPWLREYVKADAEAGNFQVYLEVAAADGKFKGYAKPLMQNVDMYRAGEDAEGPVKRAWEGLLDFATNVLENEKEDQLGARVPLEGTLDDPDTGVFETIVSVLRNGFIQAFARSLEGSISLRNVRRDLRDIGEGDAKETKEASADSAKKKPDRDKG